MFKSNVCNVLINLDRLACSRLTQCFNLLGNTCLAYVICQCGVLKDVWGNFWKYNFVDWYNDVRVPMQVVTRVAAWLWGNFRLRSRHEGRLGFRVEQSSRYRFQVIESSTFYRNFKSVDSIKSTTRQPANSLRNNLLTHIFSFSFNLMWQYYSS